MFLIKNRIRYAVVHIISTMFLNGSGAFCNHQLPVSYLFSYDAEKTNSEYLQKAFICLFRKEVWLL